MTAPRSLPLRPAIIIAFACLLMPALQGWIEWSARTDQVRETKATVVNLASSLVQHAEDTFEVADTTVLDLVERLETDGTSPLVLAQIDRKLVAQIAAEPRYRAINVLGPDGIWLASSHQAKGGDDADRAYFRHHRGDPDPGPFVGPPIQSRVGGDWVITVSRRFRSADGGFGGVVLAVINLSYFVDHYATYDLGPDSSIGLLSPDGTLLARYPSFTSLIGQNVAAKATVFSKLGEHSSGSFENNGSIDGIRRFAGYRRSSHYPVVVVAAVSREHALAAWRDGACEDMAIALVLSGAVGLLGLYLIRQVRRSQVAEERVRQSEARYRLQAEQHRVNEERLRMLLDGVADYGIYWLDANGYIQSWNAGAHNLKGYTAEEIVGKHFCVFFTEEDQARGLPGRVLQEAAETGKYAADGWRLRKDGSRFWARVLVEPVRGTDGRLIGFAKINHDESWRREAEQRRMDALEEFQAVLDTMVDGLIITDELGYIKTFTRMAERIFGYRDHEVLAQNIKMLMPDLDHGRHDGYIEHYRATGEKKVIGTGREVMARRKDGTVFPIELGISAYKVAEKQRFVGIVRDVTIRKQVEEALRQRDESLQLAWRGTGVGMWNWDIANNQRNYSDRFMELLGYGPGELPNHYDEWAGRLHPDDKDATLSALQAHVRDQALYDVEYRLMTKSGEWRWFHANGQAMWDADGKPVRMAGSLADITESKRQRQALEAANANLDRLSRHLAKARDRAEQANRAKSRFLAGMSHEMRTPLNGILGYARLLQMEGGLNATQATRVDAMLGAGSHLLQMITSVLDLSEIEAEHIEMRAVEVDVQTVAQACLDLIRPAADAKRLALGIAVAPDTPRELSADPMRLRQVLLNLLGNAAKFTSQGSIELRLRPAADGSMLRIEVADTGPGIPAEQRQRLFQDFERLDIEATRTGEGAGLGLALSARLASLMGGHLGHEDNPGGGSVFWVELPLRNPQTVPAAVAPASAEQDDVPPPRPGRVLRVLIVDDVFMNRDIARSFVQAGGHEATVAEGGAEAVAAVASTDFDVVLMDVRMPQMDGLEATRHIRALRGSRGQVPIVALTAQAFTDQVEACRAAGMDSHLAKPFEMDTLLAAVARAVEARQPPDAGLEPAPTPTAIPPPPIDMTLPVLDRKLFERTAGFLTPETLAHYMRTIAELGESLLCGLRESDALTRAGKALAEAAHTLAGSAGMFGFERLAAAGRGFEWAVQSGAAEAPALAAELCAAVEAARQVIHNRGSDVTND